MASCWPSVEFTKINIICSSSVFTRAHRIFSYNSTDEITWFSWSIVFWHMMPMSDSTEAHTNIFECKEVSYKPWDVEFHGRFFTKCPFLSHTTNKRAQLQLAVARAHKTIAGTHRVTKWSLGTHRVTKWSQGWVNKSVHHPHLTLLLRP